MGGREWGWVRGGKGWGVVKGGRLWGVGVMRGGKGGERTYRTEMCVCLCVMLMTAVELSK